MFKMFLVHPGLHHTTCRNVLASRLAPMQLPHPTVTPRILCSGQAIPVSPLIVPTTRNKPRPNVPTPIPTAKPTRATQRKPTTAPTIYPPTKPITSFKTHPSPAYIEYDNDDHDNTPAGPNNVAIQINSPRGLANISRQALYHVINLAFNSPPKYTIPQALAGSHDHILHSIDIEEVCSGVVHPVTKETITKYTKLMHNPVLSPLWVPAMSKELHRLAQGKVGTTVGTNTIFFLSHDKIRRIPKDRTVTYVHIVIDHWPQKDDPNCVRITIGGNLIDYPYKLTTRTANMVLSKIMWNSIISTANAKFSGADIMNMYLETPLD
jgi:hypothetical protein